MKKKLFPLIIVLSMIALSVFAIAACGLFGDNDNNNIAIETITIIGPNQANIGADVNFIANVLPTNATNTTITWSISGANEVGATITQAGIFRATSAGNATIAATAGGITATHDIVINSVPVNVVRIIGGNSFRYDSHLSLQVEILPLNASNKNVTFAIVSEGTTAQGAAVSGAILTATGTGNINVRATSIDGGVESAVFAVTVTEIPVTSIAITNTRDTDFEMFNYHQPFNTSYITNTNWKLSANGASYVISTNNFISLSSTTSYMQLTRSLAVTTGDRFSITIEASRGTMSASALPQYSFDGGTTWLPMGGWMSFGTTWTTVRRDFVFERSGNALIRLARPTTGATSAIAVRNATITLITQVPSFEAGQQLSLTSNVLPSNATNRAITFEIIAQGTTAAGANVEGNIISATGAGVIRLRPSTLNFVGEPFYVVVV